MNNLDVSWAGSYATIVIEGCDGAGKSTLANRIAVAHGHAIVHSARTPDGLDLVDRYQRILARIGRFVLDRCFLSEAVYGPLYRGHSRLTCDQIIGLAVRVADRDGVCVHVTAPPTVIAERIAARGEPRGLSTVEAAKITARYEEVFIVIADHVPVLFFDTADE
jgi:thymidylate kinase